MKWQKEKRKNIPLSDQKPTITLTYVTHTHFHRTRKGKALDPLATSTIHCLYKSHRTSDITNKGHCRQTIIAHKTIF